MAMTVNGVGATIQDGGARVRKFLGPNIGNSAYICAVPGRAISGRVNGSTLVEKPTWTLKYRRFGATSLLPWPR
jgi:hypothetical protein